MANPVVSPERAPFVREVFEQMLNQLEAIQVHPTHFAAWIRYLDLKEQAKETGDGLGSEEEWLIDNEADNMVDWFMDDAFHQIQGSIMETLAIGRALDPDFDQNYATE